MQVAVSLAQRTIHADHLSVIVCFIFVYVLYNSNSKMFNTVFIISNLLYNNKTNAKKPASIAGFPSDGFLPPAGIGLKLLFH
ncbi:hypothetical protein SAMN05880570_1614 [Paenibacillus sp. RU4T]|nr:hypothetical protein SAMN05880555_1616 [Paenibacillus sp. RU4X]SIQ61917.1 hypothetical protein SAMN05880570_1614 [Paenibacillus sp. RU4T]